MDIDEIVHTTTLDSGTTYVNENPHLDWEAHKLLQQAIRCGDEKMILRLIRKGAPMNGIPNLSNAKPIHLAVTSQSPKIVKLLLDKGANANVTTWKNDSPLTLAAQIENTAIIDILLSRGVGNHESYDGLTHFHVACMTSRIDIVRRLLQTDPAKVIGNMHRVVIETSIYFPGYTAVHFAVHFGSVAIAQLLLENRASIIKKDARKLTPLHLAHLYKKEKMTDMILAHHKNVLKNPCNAEGLSHFHTACTRNDPSLVKHFLRFNVDVNEEVVSGQYKGWRPIHFAISNECPKVVEVLVKHPVNFKSRQFPDLMKYAYSTGNKVMYNLITSSKINIVANVKNQCAIPALHHACIQNDLGKVQELYENNINGPIDLNERIWTGCAPLHLAVTYQSIGVLRFLLQNGADIMVQNSQGKTPLHIAFESRFEGLCTLILDSWEPVSSVNVTDNSGFSILHIFCALGEVDLVKPFLRKKANLNLQVGNDSACWAGFTPLHFAVRFLQVEVLDLLLRHKANILIKNQLNMTPVDLLIVFLEESEYDDNFDEYETNGMLMKIISAAFGKLINFKDDKISPLHLMCLKTFDETNLPLIRKYLKSHPDAVNQTIDMPRSVSLHKCTPLHLAMRSNDFAKAKLLLQNGADPIMLNYTGEKAFECGFSRGLDLFDPQDIDECRDLFALIVDRKEYLKPSHFHIACGAGIAETVKYILDHVPNNELLMKYLNCCNGAGHSPLHAILDTDNFSDLRKEIAQLLLEK
ncbi:hypothetical protein QAD02_001052 [Eretmocerus hayati]|uniref:Uncharacterized protein n=1 Tax=Eretmocerus hayati TaxID=131215 RepID=A0ACC2NFU7_9HYME|nr:hypothetical protein QAD02_001052 [Eretmocerus hayati]